MLFFLVQEILQISLTSLDNADFLGLTMAADYGGCKLKTSNAKVISSHFSSTLIDFPYIFYSVRPTKGLYQTLV